MILPKEVKTRNKVRDFKIVQLYSQGQTQEEIGQRFHLTKQAISNIIYKNRHLLKLDIDYEKSKRVVRLKRIFDKTTDELSPKKDILNVISEMRSEIEGDGKSETTINNITYNINGSRKNSRLEVLSASQSADNS